MWIPLRQEEHQEEHCIAHMSIQNDSLTNVGKSPIIEVPKATPHNPPVTRLPENLRPDLVTFS